MSEFRFTEEQRIDLKSGALLDVLDPFRVWCKARVLKTRRHDRGSSQVYITYLGWDSKWDEWIDTASPRLQPWCAHTRMHWTGGPNHPLPAQLLLGPIHPSPINDLLPGLKYQFVPAPHARRRKAPRKYWLPTLVMDDDESRPPSSDCRYHPYYSAYDLPDDDRSYSNSEDENSCSEHQDAGGDDEIRALVEETDAIDSSFARNNVSDQLEVECDDSFSLLFDKHSESNSWVAEGYCESDTLSVSEFDVVSFGTAVVDEPEPPRSELSSVNDEWEMLGSRDDDASANLEPPSMPYRNALMKKAGVPVQMPRLRSRRTPLARIDESNKKEKETPKEDHDEPGGEDWLEGLRDQVKSTAGGKPELRFKGNKKKDRREKAR